LSPASVAPAVAVKPRTRKEGKSVAQNKCGHPLFYQIVEEITALHDAKNRQYATQDDPLGNFRRTGQIIRKMLKPGLNPTLASCLAFMSKQVDGVYEIFGEDKRDTVDSLDDKLLDIAVYAIIGLILVREGATTPPVPAASAAGQPAPHSPARGQLLHIRSRSPSSAIPPSSLLTNQIASANDSDDPEPFSPRDEPTSPSVVSRRVQ
jgi:hypothetical protein